MKYASLALMLKDWDELAIAGVSPGKHDSIMTITEMDGRDQRIDIEYRHEVTTNHKQYLICYLVAYDQLLTASNTSRKPMQVKWKRGKTL
jgi:hypothetical protein